MDEIDKKTIQGCARDAIDLAIAIDTLKMGYGFGVIGDRIDRFADSCDVLISNKQSLMLEIEDGISSLKEGKHDLAHKCLADAKVSALIDALNYIR